MDIEQVREGMRVRDARGARVGEVASVESDAFVVEQGFFFPKDFTVRFDHVTKIHGRELWVDLTAEELLRGVGYVRSGAHVELDRPDR